MKLNDLITITEAAELVGCSRQNIHQWINKGFLGFIKMGSQKLVNKDAVLATSELMEKRRHDWIKRRGESAGVAVSNFPKKSKKD